MILNEIVQGDIIWINAYKCSPYYIYDNRSNKETDYVKVRVLELNMDSIEVKFNKDIIVIYQETLTECRFTLEEFLEDLYLEKKLMSDWEHKIFEDRFPEYFI